MPPILQPGHPDAKLPEVVLRDLAVAHLLRSRAFAVASRRLLFDLVEAMPLRRLDETTDERSGFRFLVVIRGRVFARQGGDVVDRRKLFALGGEREVFELEPAAYWDGDPPFSGQKGLHYQLAVRDGEIADVVLMDYQKWEVMLRGSPALFHSLTDPRYGFRPPSGGGGARGGGRGPRGHGPAPRGTPGISVFHPMRERGELLPRPWMERAGPIEGARDGSDVGYLTVALEGESDLGAAAMAGALPPRFELSNSELPGLRAQDPSDSGSGTGGTSNGGAGNVPQRPPPPSGGTGTDGRVEWIWIAAEPGLYPPFRALAQLAAAAVAEQFGKPTGVLEFGSVGTPTLQVWRNGEFHDVALSPAPPLSEIEDKLRARGGSASSLHHLFVVYPENSLTRPPAYPMLTVHRIGYLTRSTPHQIEHGLEGLLDPGVFPTPDPSHPYFSAFVASVVLDPVRAPPWTLLDSLWSTATRAIGVSTAPGFDAMGFGLGKPLQPKAWAMTMRERLHRDLCRLRLDLGALAQEWAAWEAAPVPGTSFPSQLFTSSQNWRDLARRWVRALTNRRAGMAISGGGASSFRAVPFFEMLADRVPLDVVSGVSGGALVGGFYCANGRAGVDAAIDKGWTMSASALPAMIDSSIVEVLLDHFIGGARVEDLETRFVPVATALGQPVEICAIISGTLGEGIRASGSLPMQYGPTKKIGVRWADGATGTYLPALIASYHGADVVLACSCLPGPKRGNPLAEWMIGKLLYWHTPLGRLLDGWTSSAFLLKTATRMAGVSADEFWEASDQEWPLLEAPRFHKARAIVDASLRVDGETIRESADRFVRVWGALP